MRADGEEEVQFIGHVLGMPELRCERAGESVLAMQGMAPRTWTVEDAEPVERSWRQRAAAAAVAAAAEPAVGRPFECWKRGSSIGRRSSNRSRPK